MGKRNILPVLIRLLILLALLAPGILIAQDEQKEPAVTEEIQVTATRIPEAVEPEPASITIVTGDQLRETGARDLPNALSLVAGVSVAPGTDNGPASSVPEIWGLREFDAFLLVVDGVPWGGAFNPALSTLDLHDIERIEILRGAAPVMYGATSFVGVIHVIHKAASAPGNAAQAWFGNFTSGGGSVRVALPSSEAWKHALSANFDSQGFKDDRTGYNRSHVLYRGEHKTDGGLFHFDTDLTFLRQDPASPHPREGATLSPLVPLDANHNPSDSQQDENRYHFVGGYDQKIGDNNWSFLGAVTRSNRHITKGFLGAISNEEDPNTAGYRQTQEYTDIYLDTHFSVKPQESMNFLLGADYLYGKGDAKAENFDYFIRLNGSNPPNSFDSLVQERPQLQDTRNFFGVYAQTEWNASSRLLVQAGLRVNVTREKKHGKVLPGDPGGAQEVEEDLGVSKQNNNRLSGTIGASFLTWSSQNDGIWIFADYRNAFKPAAIDFGPEAEGDLLKPEDARSYEGGVKGRMLARRFDWQASVFLMDFTNLVSSGQVNGLPVLINAGKDRFKGFDFEAEGEMRSDLRWRVNYSFHSSKFRDFIQDFDGVPTQLAGKRLEMVPRHLLGAGILYYPATGINGSFILNYTGERFLNKRNTAIADAYTTLALGIGYRFGSNNLRFDAVNLTDERPPVSESELGDAQYYRLPARTFSVSWQVTF